MQIYLNNGPEQEEMIIMIICYIYCPVSTQNTEQQISIIIFLSFVKLIINGTILKLGGTVLKTK